MSERALVTLDWPADPDVRQIGTLVLGGVAARTELPVDRVEELGLAVDALARASEAPRIQLEIDVAADRLTAAIGPFGVDPLQDEAVGRIVRALSDEAKPVTRAGEQWVSLVVRLPPG